MSEKASASKQHSYEATSNLVLDSSDQRVRGGEPTGEVGTLVGKYSASALKERMGSRITRERPAELEQRMTKAKRKRDEQEESEPKKMQKVTDVTVLTAEVDHVYRPQSKKTQAAYEVLLTFIQQVIGDKPHDVLRSAADEVISILKDTTLKDKERQREIEEQLSNQMTDDKFSRLVNIGTKITDYRTDTQLKAAEAKAAEAVDDEHGVAVVFDEEEEEEDLEEAYDENIVDDEEGDVTSKTFAIKTKMDIMDDEEDKKNILDERAIDAFWIQRQLAQFKDYKDPHKSQRVAEECYALLCSDDSDGDVENKFVLKLDYEKFKFIKLMLRNRQKIVYCVKLARSKDASEREEIEKEMEENPKLRPILEALKKTATSAEKQLELNKTLAKEVRGLAQTRSVITEDGEEGSAEVVWHNRPKQILDLESLAFEGGHFMSNEQVQLPKSEVIHRKGFQEVHIPPLKSKPFLPGEKLKPIDEIPAWTHSAFKDMKTLNRVQSKVYDAAFTSAENILLCAPTGAGKTNVAMLTMLREIGIHRKADGTIDKDAFKIVYIAPMKSLVQEVVLNFGQRLEGLGIAVKELSGDNSLTKAQIEETQVIVATPEKWDIITRKSGDRTYTQLVKLVIIDEIHLLHDSRGPVLESVVSRTIRQIESTQELIRLVGLSATLPNYEDVAMFLRVKPNKGLFFFDNSYRPVPLQQQFIGITQKKAFKRQQTMNEICYEKVLNHAGKNQVLVFVHSRKETASTAKALRDMAVDKDDLAKFVADDSGRRELLTSEAEAVNSADLKEMLPYGFAIHHAGLTRADRTLVEELFADNHIQVLVSTATLAWGVNLPAHTVIIKGTQVYSPELGRWTELSPLDIMQMLGRAGRPQYDTEGEAIVITSHKELHYYLSLMNEQLPVESQFISKLADNLNAEIVLGSVQNVKEGVTWLGYTYLYVRMLRAPQLYGISSDTLETDPQLEQRRLDLIHSAAVTLDKHNLIKYDRKTGSFQVTDLGRVASHYYITHQSISVFNEYLKPSMSDIELFRVFSLSSEFRHMTVREEEKMELAKLLDKVPIPVKESIEEPSAKVNVLLQAYISRLTLEGFALLSDMVYITQSAGRLMRALFEMTLKRGWAGVAAKCLELSKMVTHRMWGAQSPLRQFRGIPPEIIKRIEAKDFPWERFYDLQWTAIGELIRFPKMGRKIHKCVHQLPRLELQGHVQPITRAVLRVELNITPDFMFDEKVHGLAEPFWIIVEDVDGETILHYEYFILKKKFASEEHSVNFTIPIFDPIPPQYYVRVLSDRWLGSEVVLPISFRHLILPERYPPSTELLDLQPTNVITLANEKYIKFFAGRFELFNPIQTQCFNTVFKKDDNTLIAAPTGSGKTVLAELAILRMLSLNPKGRCVYVAPLPQLVQERYADWKETLGLMGLSVAKLTGESSVDLRLLAEAQIILSTPEHWDVMSRRWKTRANVQNVKLFIVDELHLIGGTEGPVLEVIVSRMRYIAAQTDKPIRILGLMTSVANAKDLGDWIGATSHSLFSFHPNVRPVPLEIRIQGFDINAFEPRQLAMIKPTYQSILKLSPDKPVIVFVPNRKQARNVAIDLMTFAASDDQAKRFLHVQEKDIAPHLEHVRNKALVLTLKAGVAFYHEGLSDKEKLVVQKLYKAGAVQVLVCVYSLCWGLPMNAHLVVLMGTQTYDGREHRYVDMPITDVIQMMGRACRPLLDTNGKCTIFCQASKKEFYKKFLYDPFPVESHLDHYLHDHMNAEIITKRIENLQDAVDFLTWSFFYRRLVQNPNYYNLQGVSHRHVSDHLSELVENVLDDLKTSKCISIEGNELAPLNLGMIAAYYYIRYTTVELFNSSLQSATTLPGLLEILSNSSEFENIQVRHKEDFALKKLAHHLPLKIPKAGQYNEPHVKTNVLLQSHFSRVSLSAAAKQDQDTVLPLALRLLQAMVDVISSSGWLSPALACMEMSQMVTMGCWNNDSRLLQLPHFDKALAKKCDKARVKEVPDLLEMEDDDRSKLLDLSPAKLRDVAVACNAYPDIEVKYTVEDEKRVRSGERVVLAVTLTRDPEEEEDDGSNGVPRCIAPRFPELRTEGWWLVVGRKGKGKNELTAIKRVAMNKKMMKIKLDFVAPEQGTHDLVLYLMSDSWLGCDQEYAFKLNVAEGAAMEESSSGSDEEDDDDEE
eukprot:gb/GEZN01000104.1/.p1 GENE.gb/GEZN01000104.1/~~gb/GEZN01000104.1/.p1  ORF type:complete len:2168 (+),score=390.44 gb/GEZN01000104.1/:405-6908(+)